MGMSVGSLFCGIGGIDLGLERVGMEVRWQVELDEFCNRVLAKHWADVVRFRDVREVGAHNLEPVELIAGGFPCQDISVAGKGAGLDGERSGLWFEFLRVVRELRPTWVLAENVPALRTRGGDIVLAGLAEAGYSCWPLVVGARHVGAPHRRDRVWIVARRLGDTDRRDCDGGADLAQRCAEGRAAAVGASAADVGHAAGAGRGPAWRAVDARESGAGALDVAARADQELGNTDARRRRRQDDAVRAGRHEPVGADAAVADREGGGWQDEGDGRIGGSGTGRDGAQGPVGLAHGHGHGREGERRGGLLDGERPAQQHDADGRYRWPARPGEQQHEWEEPRTIELPVGGATSRLSERLAGRHRRAALKALGNSVVPQVVELIGRAILAAEKRGE